MEYLQVWDPLEGVILQQGVPDQFRWKLSQSGSYSSKTAYAACFVGSIRFPPWRRIWKSWAPLRCKFFLWLAIKQRIWTADRLAKRGLLIASPSGDCLTMLLALFATRNRKQPSISFSLVCSPGNAGR